MSELRRLAERVWRELDSHQTGVIRGVPDDFYGVDPRINVFDVAVDEGEQPHLTVGLFLGNHQWVMRKFSPEQCIGIIGLLLSKPSVAAALRAREEVSNV